MTTHRFSVIIPSFGQAQYLREAIESVLQQTYANIEIIVVDDGSTDGSLDIAKSYRPAVTVISQRNKGLASARNAGIMNATGEYIFPLDADDKMFPDCLETIDRVARETNADVIAPSIRCFGEAMVGPDTILMPNPTFNDFKLGNRLAYCSAVKRSVLLETGGYSPKMDILGGYEDLHLWFDLLSRGKKIVTIPEPLVMYRIKESSMYKEASKPEKHVKLMEQIFKDFPMAFPTEEEKESVKKQYPKR